MMHFRRSYSLHALASAITGTAHAASVTSAARPSAVPISDTRYSSVSYDTDLVVPTYGYGAETIGPYTPDASFSRAIASDSAASVSAIVQSVLSESSVSAARAASAAASSVAGGGSRNVSSAGFSSNSNPSAHGFGGTGVGAGPDASLTTGAKAGVAVGVVLAILALLLGAGFWLRRKRKYCALNAESEGAAAEVQGREVGGASRLEGGAPEYAAKNELGVEEMRRYELDGGWKPAEMAVGEKSAT